MKKTGRRNPAPRATSEQQEPADPHQRDFLAKRFRPTPDDSASMQHARQLLQQGGGTFKVPDYKGGGVEVLRFADPLPPEDMPLWRIEYNLLFADERHEV